MVDPSRMKMLRCYLICLLSLSPMGLCASGIISHHSTELPAVYFVDDRVRVFFLDYGVRSPLLTVICFPLVINCFISRHFPNMFKRMGLSLLLLCVLFTFYLMIYIIGESQNYLERFGVPCFANNSLTFFKQTLLLQFLQHIY